MTTPSPSRTTRSAKAAANSTSWVATRTAAPRSASAVDQLDELVLARPVHSPRRLVEGDQAGQLVAFHPPGQRDREGEALALAAREVPRVGVDRVLEPDDRAAPPGPPRPEARRRPARGPGSRPGSASGAPSRGASRSCPAPARRARRPPAAGCSCRPRFAPSGRPARPRPISRSIPAARPACSSSRSSSTQRLLTRQRRAGPVARMRGAAVDPRSVLDPPHSRATRPSCRAGSASRVFRASLTPTGSGSSPASENMRAAGVSRAASALTCPLEKLARGAVEGDRARVHRDHAIGGGEAALEPVFGEQDRHPPLLVQPPQQPDQLVAGDGVELGGGLVEQDEPGPGDERGGEGDPLQLAPREGVDGTLEQVRYRRAPAPPPRRRGPAPPAGRRAAPAAARARRRPWSRRPGSRGPGRRSRRAPPSSPGPVAIASTPPTSTAPSTSPPWKCGTSPQAARSRVVLPQPERPASTDELARRRSRARRRAGPAPAARG